MSSRKLDKLPNEILSSNQLYQAISDLNSLVGPKSRSKDERFIELPESIGCFFRKPPTIIQLADLKTELETIIQTAPAVRLTLSDFPDMAFYKRLADWFRDIHPYCLVEIVVDNSIIGGVIIRSGHRIIDHSIRTQLSEVEDSLTGILADA